MEKQKQKLKGLEELPEFEEYPFDGKTEVPIYEIARITFKTTPQSYPPYQKQEILGVVGTNEHHDLIYSSRVFMLRKNGELLAICGDSAKTLDIDFIERYEIIVLHSELTKIRPNRRI